MLDFALGFLCACGMVSVLLLWLVRGSKIEEPQKPKEPIKLFQKKPDHRKALAYRSPEYRARMLAEANAKFKGTLRNE